MKPGHIVCVAASLAAVILIGAASVACSSRQFATNGERIYHTASSESGETITRTGGNRFLPFLAKDTCAGCHGPDGKGNSATGVSDITWKALSTMGHIDKPLVPTAYAHTGHSAYDDASLKKAIMEGVTPDGERLKDTMPRWKMSPADLDDLVVFIKML